jgi:DNA-directed RNA polymerase specialized sigma24 family protein
VGDPTFVNAAARAMRRILIDRARAREGHAPARVAPIETSLPTLDSNAHCRARRRRPDRPRRGMEVLRARDERQHDVVMLRFFAGLSIDEAGLALGLSAGTIKNEWSYALAWLMREIETCRG